MEIDKYKAILKVINKLPKPNLHLHLDGSLSPSFIHKQAILDNVELEPEASSDIVKYLWNINNTKFFEEYYKRKLNLKNWVTFGFCNQFLQKKDQLTEATKDIALRFCLEYNCNLVEIRFAPVLHTNKGLSLLEVLESVNEGFNKGKLELKEKYNKELHGGIIVCALRSFGNESAVQTVELIDQFRSQCKLDCNSVIGFDIAGDEGKYPLKLYEKALQLANQKGIQITCHAGEWNDATDQNQIENMKLCLQYKVKRVGHGLILGQVQVPQISQLLEEFKQKEIGIEICLTSNYGRVQFQKHPLKFFLEKQLKPVALNVDNSLLSGNEDTGLPTPDTEIMRALLDCEITVDNLMKVIENGYQYSFDKSVSQEWIKKQMDQWIKSKLFLENLLKI